MVKVKRSTRRKLRKARLRYLEDLDTLDSQLNDRNKKGKLTQQSLQNRQVIKKRLYGKLSLKSKRISEKTLRAVLRKYKKDQKIHAKKVINKIREENKLRAPGDKREVPTEQDVIKGMKTLGDKLTQDKLQYGDDT